jgi:hypothetical protein
MMTTASRGRNPLETTQIERADRLQSDLDLQTLASGDVVCVQTRNTEYRIRLIDPSGGSAIIDGGSAFGESETVEIIGACNNLGLPLGPRRICVGRGLLLLHHGSWVRTSRVLCVSLERGTAFVAA